MSVSASMQQAGSVTFSLPDISVAFFVAYVMRKSLGTLYPLVFMTGSKVCFDVDQIPSTPAFVLFGRS